VPAALNCWLPGLSLALSRLAFIVRRLKKERDSRINYGDDEKKKKEKIGREKPLLIYPKVALTSPSHPHRPVPPCSGATRALLRRCPGNDQRNRQTWFRPVGSTLRFEWQLFARPQFLGHRWSKTGTPPQPNCSSSLPSKVT
jgi:hypothetical protein